MKLERNSYASYCTENSHNLSCVILIAVSKESWRSHFLLHIIRVTFVHVYVQPRTRVATRPQRPCTFYSRALCTAAFALSSPCVLPHLKPGGNHNLCDINSTTRILNIPSTCRTAGRYATQRPCTSFFIHIKSTLYLEFYLISFLRNL